MQTIQGSRLKLDKEGYLVDPTAWNPAVAVSMAQRDGCMLTSEHWLLIGHLQRYFHEYGIAPELSLITRYLRRQHSVCRWTCRYIESLFPGGAKTACHYAGLPKPLGRSCLG